MTTSITYSLGGTPAEVRDYYETVAAFADEVLAQADALVAPLAEEFRGHVEAAGLESPRTGEEYALELLTLGVLWRVYSDEAHELAPIPRRLLTALAECRRQGCPLKPGIDFLRGILGTAFLAPNEYDPADMVDPTLEHLDQLLGWLAATGDFLQEGRRLSGWRAHLAGLASGAVADRLASAITFAAWFEERSDAVLGRYTANVRHFLEEGLADHRWREDYISCGRQPVEYHLNMVGAEIMNRVFREEFLSAEHRLVLVPACLRLHQNGECRARQAGGGMHCSGCAPACRAHHLTRLGEKHGFAVLLAAHESQVFTGESRGLLGDGVGVVGVTCVTNLMAGGWKARAMGIPVQCVLLDYCGCKQHWHEEGIPTALSLSQLRRVLGIAD